VSFNFSHQCLSTSLQPPNRGKATTLAVKIYAGNLTVSDFVKDAERGKLDVESSQLRVRTRSTCLSVARVSPDCAEHIPPLLGGHLVTDSRGEAFY
jgi:hypothetical protein